MSVVIPYPPIPDDPEGPASIPEVIQLRDRMEEWIAEAIKGFEAATGLTVVSVSIAPTSLGRELVSDIKLTR